MVREPQERLDEAEVRSFMPRKKLWMAFKDDVKDYSDLFAGKEWHAKILHKQDIYRVPTGKIWKQEDIGDEVVDKRAIAHMDVGASVWKTPLSVLALEEERVIVPRVIIDQVMNQLAGPYSAARVSGEEPLRIDTYSHAGSAE